MSLDQLGMCFSSPKILEKWIKIMTFMFFFVINYGAKHSLKKLGVENLPNTGKAV